MNKIVTALLVTMITFMISLLISALLDIAWIQGEASRQIMVYLMMVVTFLIGFIIFKNIFTGN